MVIGGGAAGLTAARQAVRAGARTALIQASRVGGDCTFTGCVPSKTLLAAAARGESFSGAMAAVQTTEVIHGRAVLRSPSEIDVDGARLRSRRIIVATGAGPAVPPIAGLADVAVLTNENVFDLAVRPERLAVLGGGPIGVELAQAFARLGSAVTVVEIEPRLLPSEEPEASRVIADALTRDGVAIRTGDHIAEVEPRGSSGAARLHLAAGPELDADRVLVATGRRPATSGFGLTEIGVALDDQGYVRTDTTLPTSVPGVWAIGDVTGRMAFTHAAARMAFVAVHNALRRSVQQRLQRFDPAPIPGVTFTAPEVGPRRHDRGPGSGAWSPGRFPARTAVDRAITSAQTDGFVKLIAGPRRLVRNAGGGRIFGATVVAPTGGELIHEAALAMHTRMFTGRLAQATHAYPTWSTAIQQAAAQFFVELDGRSARPARNVQGDRPGS